jgi:hypothetical protein
MSDISTFDEAFDHLNGLFEQVAVVQALHETDNFKFMTRTAREVIFKGILEELDALKDTLTVIVKAGRAVKRDRLRDDEQLSRMMIAMAEQGLKATDYESVSATVALYASDSDPQPT